MSAYAIRVSPAARASLLALTDTAFQTVSARIDLLSTTPYLGGRYDPSYEAARPPFECRVTYAGAYGLYYSVDEDAREVYLRYVENQRMNPARRFQGRLSRGI